ncbi:MAG TPA: hypothetical protein VFG01_01800 [Acidobacteriota bacterium]|nr:hypothetical protein [Acidobacteriota bacterium]
MKFKELLLLLVIIIAGIIFYHAQTGNLDLYIELGDEFFTQYDLFTFEDEQQLIPPFPKKIEIINQQGDVKVYCTDRKEVSIYTQKKIRHKIKEKAREKAKESEILINQDSEKIIISAERDRHINSRVRTDLELYIPRDFSLKISNSYGLVEVKGMKNVEIINKNGKVTASDINENLKVLTSYKPIYVENISGNCQIEGLRSQISVIKVKGETLIKNKYGSIDLFDLSQKVTINGLHCQITGKNIKGPIEAENSYEPIELSNINAAKIRADNSPIKIFGAQNKLDIKNKYNRIQLNDIYGNINIEGESLEILGENMFGESISISSSYRNIDLNHFTAETVISFSHGKITLSPSAKDIKPITVKGEYAEIDFIFPLGLEIPIQAQTKSGQIKWELSQKGVEQISNGFSIIKAFLEKDEKPIVSLFTTYSTILVRESS